LLSIDIKFTIEDTEFPFEAEIKPGNQHTFTVGDPAVMDKLFWVLVGLDKNYQGEIRGEGICFKASSWNNVLALGDRSMFISGTVYKNIYKAMRVRANRTTSRQRTEEVIEKYDLQLLSKMNIKLLTEEELMRIAVARAHFRKIALVVAKQCETQDFTKWPDAYIIKIT